MKATKIRNLSSAGHAIPGMTANHAKQLYRLDPPLEGHEYVVVSAATVLGEPETYIFAADPDGTITDWVELDGSFKGALDHEAALRGAGYEVA